MKKSVMMMAIAAMALTVACTGKKTTDNVDNQDSTSLVDSSAAIAPIDLTTIAGTYEGTLPAADGPGIKTIVTLNADSFISQFQNILSNIGFNAVPQYSVVYNQIQSVPQNHESDKIEIPRNTEKSSPNFSIFIGDEEIKNFVVSTLNEANAISGGASF